MNYIMILMIFEILLVNQVDPKPETFNLTFKDNDSVNVSLDTKELEINTEYGTLVIPIAEITEVEFAFRLLPTEQKQIDGAILDLSSDKYEKREKALLLLKEIGKNAYPPVREALAHVNEEEGKKRLQLLVTHFKDRYPSSDLQYRTTDRIKAKLTVVGLLQTEYLTVKHRRFPVVKIHIMDLLSIYKTNSSNLVSVKSNSWIPTGIILRKHDELKCEASGDVDMWAQTPGQYVVGPEGYSDNGEGSAFPAGALLGKIGNKIFILGANFKEKAPQIGELYVRINDSRWQGGMLSGQFNAFISVHR